MNAVDELTLTRARELVSQLSLWELWHEALTREGVERLVSGREPYSCIALWRAVQTATIERRRACVWDIRIAPGSEACLDADDEDALEQARRIGVRHYVVSLSEPGSTYVVQWDYGGGFLGTQDAASHAANSIPDVDYNLDEGAWT